MSKIANSGEILAVPSTLVKILLAPDRLMSGDRTVDKESGERAADDDDIATENFVDRL